MSNNPISVQPSVYKCTQCGAELIPGSTACKGCGLAFHAPVPAPNALTSSPPVAAVSASAWLAPEQTASLQVRLSSGQAYTVQEILLFDQIAFTTAANLKAQALEKLGGFQSGLGTIGSLSQVLVSSMIIGSVENAVSANMRKEGFRMLEQAETMTLQSRRYSYFFRPSQIFSVELPLPEMWQATLPVSATESRRFTHNGDPMVMVRLNDGKTLSIMWDKVESYEQTSFS